MNLVLRSLIMMGLMLPFSSRAVTGGNPYLEKPLARNQLLNHLQAGADYLLRVQQEDGSFKYISDPMERCCANPQDKTYSMVRHLGASYSLIRSYQLTSHKGYLRAASKSVRFALKRIVKQPQFWYAQSDGGVSLGENGFLLMNLAMLSHYDPSQTFATNAAHRVAKFLLKYLRYDGVLATEGQWAEHQAAIGLLFYDQWVQTDPETFNVVRNFMDQVVYHKKHSHWSVQTLRWMLQKDPKLAPLYLPSALEAGETLLTGVRTRGTAENEQRVGGKGQVYGSCGATARNEGLLAIANIAELAGDGIHKAFYEERAREHVAYALQFQYGNDHILSALDANLLSIASAAGLRGAVFNDPESGWVRIDFVSHHLRALADYLDFRAQDAFLDIR